MAKESHASFLEERYRLLEMSEISILTKGYDDIFSDFDPRNFSQRSLSEDFLFEAKRAAKDKNSGTIQLRFMVPHRMRNPEKEMVIKKRLHEHFRHHYELIMKEKRDMVRKGIVMTAIGILLLLAATFASPMQAKSFLMRLIFVTLEPTSWFIAWYGLDNIFSKARHGNPDYDFYRKMAKCEILFFSY